ncbi:MAG TPA: aminotransferase class I/II-fold pyridoxal phosphate-dependent enzyme [Candidatus Nanoarchaeia archaeon]|nr:aminotransferase class I/II-fold pyridoxal phosphate-dependent enzyme [Candidatus Nanoarchaeia archaeon]
MVHISERERELPEAVIAKLLKIAEEDKNIISLGPGQPDFSLPEPLVQELHKLDKNCNHYAPPGGRKDLKQAIIKKLAQENNIQTEEDNIIVTVGSQEAFMLASMCSLDVGEQIILPDPGYLGYESILDIIHAIPVKLPVYQDNDFMIDPDVLKKIIDKKRTKAIVLTTPSNPTGMVIPKKILEAIADIAIDNNLYIFSDEAYEHILYDNNKHVSIGSLNGMEDNVVSMYTCSKSYAMCGFRIGYAAGPKKIIKAMTRLHPNTTISAPNPSQIIATKALTLPKKYIQTMVYEYDRRRKFLVKRLNQLNMKTLMPQGAFYTFSNIQHYSNNSFRFAAKLLQQAKVGVVPGKEFGNNGEGYIRCSYATTYEKIEEAMNRIEKTLK